MKNEIGASKGRSWLKILGIIAAAGVLLAVLRIALRVFREKPASDEVHGV